MRFDLHKQPAFRDYREAIQAADALEARASSVREGAVASGDAEAIERLSLEMSLKADELDRLSLMLSREERFLARFRVEVPEAGIVSLVLPRGASRLELLQEAQEIVRSRSGSDAIWPPALRGWQRQAEFSCPASTSEALVVKGHVEGTQGKDARTQHFEVLARGYREVSRSDVAVAHAAYTVATGGNLFGWTERSSASFGWSSKMVSLKARAYCCLFDLLPSGLSDLNAFPTHPEDADLVVMPGKVPTLGRARELP